jgi:solute carrier family 25 (mitochondrial oxoglutarate transporter), member 11
MSLYEIHDIKRDRMPYNANNNYHHRPYWAPAVNNTPLMNLKKSSVCSIIASCIVEPARHIVSALRSLNMVYELPRNTLQSSIFIREAFKTPFFWSELRKKMVYGVVQHSLDAGFKIAIFQYIYGSTWSPRTFTDYNSFKFMILCFGTAFLSGWTMYPLDVARKAYYADQSWPAELRKGYRSPLHALIKIPFSEGPLYLFRGGLPHFFGNFFGFGWLLFNYTWLKDKFFFLWKYHECNYSFCKFWILNFSFAIGALGSQPYFTAKELLDNAPKQRGGQPFFTSGYEACRYVKLRWNESQPNLLHGYWRWFRSHGAVLYITIWLADSMGLMDNLREDPWSWRVSHGYYSD